nr:chemotaxis protein CheA [Leptospiraceae bacterium]
MRKKEVSDSPSGKAAADIRIGTEKLDRLLDLIGELVIAESQVTETAAQFDENRSRLNIESWKRSAVHLHKIVRNLQETALSLRMVPLSGIFRRMERFILDLNRKTGKKIELKIFGERTEIDKNMVELIIDPLTHLLRNSADHGIESPEERTAAGKGETGRIILSAEHAGKEVWISI